MSGFVVVSRPGASWGLGSEVCDIILWFGVAFVFGSVPAFSTPVMRVIVPAFLHVCVCVYVCGEM